MNMAIMAVKGLPGARMNSIVNMLKASSRQKARSMKPRRQGG